MRDAVESSAPFVVFHVERILERADMRSAEGRDRALDELRPCSTELPGEHRARRTVRRVAGRLELTEGAAARLLAGRRAGRASAPAAGPAGPTRCPATARRPADRRGPRPERTFLALCIALPDQGADALAGSTPTSC